MIISFKVNKMEREYMFKEDDNKSSERNSCFCIGPQIVDGKIQPMCPCSMRRMHEIERKVKSGVTIFDALK